MQIKIPCKNQKDVFYNYLLFLNPLLGLRELTEIPLLSSLLYLYYRHRDYPLDTLNSLLFSDDTKEAIRGTLKVSEKSFRKSWKQLEEKGMIVNNSLNSRLLNFPKDGKFSLEIKFVEDKK